MKKKNEVEERHERVGVVAEHRDRDVLADELDPELHHGWNLPAPSSASATRRRRAPARSAWWRDQGDDEVQAEVEPGDLEDASTRRRSPSCSAARTGGEDQPRRSRVIEGSRTTRDRPAPPADSAFASYTSRATTAGTSVRANATGENQASWFSSTRARSMSGPPVASRTRPERRCSRASGETVAAHAIDSALATKFAYTMAIAMTADHPAGAPPNSAPPRRRRSRRERRTGRHGGSARAPAQVPSPSPLPYRNQMM